MLEVIIAEKRMFGLKNIGGELVTKKMGKGIFVVVWHLRNRGRNEL